MSPRTAALPVLLSSLVLSLVAASAWFPSEDPPAAAAQEFRGGTYVIDAVHSSVVFGVQHLGVSNFYGRFNDVSGTFVVDTTDPGKSSISVRIDPASVDTANGKRDDHVRSADFLDVERYPEMLFESRSVARDGERWTVAGTLTFHGVQNDVEAAFELIGSADTRMGARAGAEARFTIRRSEFGMDGMQGALGDEVSLVVSLEGVLQS